MHNCTHEIKGDKLVITIDISKKSIEDAPISSSGKTFLVGSTGGTAPVASAHCKALTYAINVMAKK